MSNRLGNPEPFFPEGTALGERSQLGMAPGEPGAGSARQAGRPDRNARGGAPLEECHSLPEAVDRPMIVTLVHGRLWPRNWFASACRTTSPLAMASARARWAAAMAWSYAPISAEMA